MRNTNILALLGACIPVSIHSFEKSNQVYIIFCPAEEKNVEQLLVKAAEVFAKQDYPVQKIEYRVPLFYRISLGRVVERVEEKHQNIWRSIHDDRNKGPPLCKSVACFNFFSCLSGVRWLI